MAHLSKGVLARSGEARGPKIEKKTIFEVDEVPNLLHPLIYFIRGLLPTTGGVVRQKGSNKLEACPRRARCSDLSDPRLVSAWSGQFGPTHRRSAYASFAK